MIEKWTDSEKKKDIKDLADRFGEAVFNNVEKESCSNYGCIYLISNLLANNLTKSEVDNYKKLICEQYPHICKINLDKN